MIIDASVIISTYNGAHKIATLLESLTRQTIASFEVITVIDGSTDNTEAVLHSFRGRFPEFKIIVQENRGRSGVRNRGALAAESDLLIFYDDDMLIDEDSVRKHIDFHNGRMNSLLAGNQIQATQSSDTDIQFYKAHLTKKWVVKYPERVSQLTFHNLFFSASNCSIPKEIFQKLNGFDDRLTDAEDYDLAWRAISSGITVLFDKSNLTTHLEFITCARYIQRLRQYSDAHRKLDEFHPERMTSRKERRRYPRIFYFLFASPTLVRMIDLDWFRPLPLGARYKFYEIVIHALAVEFQKVKIR